MFSIASDEIYQLSHRGASDQELRQNWIERDARNFNPHTSILTYSSVPPPLSDALGISRTVSDALDGSLSQFFKLPRSDDQSAEGITTPSIPDSLSSFTRTSPSPHPSL